MLLKGSICLNSLMYCSLQSVFHFHVRLEAFINVTVSSCVLYCQEQYRARAAICVSDFAHIPVYFFFLFEQLFPLNFICIIPTHFKLCAMISKEARSYLSQMKFSIYYLFYGPEENLHNREVFAKTVLKSIISCKSILIIIYENVNKSLGFFVSSIFAFCI